MPSSSSSRPLSVGMFFFTSALLLGSCSGDSDSTDGAPAGAYKHVLLISIDTTRADALGSYGGDASATPRLDKLAASGVRFADVTSAAPSTLSSHTSIMTGLYARRHGVARNGFMVPLKNVMLAEVLQSVGFHTAGFIGSFALDELFDFTQGFDHWDQQFTIEFDPRTSDQNQRPADEVTGAVLDYVSNFDGSQRLFLFAHYFDVHSPYAPPEPYATRYAKRWKRSDFGMIDHQIEKHQVELIGKTRSVYTQGISKRLAERATGESLPGDEDLAALYVGELAFLDTQIGRLLDGLQKKDILKDCIVVLTSDHGETFWEHGDFWHHGAWVYQTNVHVPLLVYLPDGRGRGRVVTDPVSTLDIYPTLLDLLGIELPEPVSGVSLVRSLDGEQLAPRAIFSEATQPVAMVEDKVKWANQLKTKAIRRGKWKYVRSPYLRYEELFDLESDPGERHNLIGSDDAQVKQTITRLRNELGLWSSNENARPSKYNSSQMGAVLKRLEALGYTGDNPAAPQAGPGPSGPQDRK